ncbi:MAG TPA: glucan 1,4-alpha-glucosidase [Blastocatellia bacterium]|nr:glucan 1,4-alpha-glucosidase [Blastocatellia bacterium]
MKLFKAGFGITRAALLLCAALSLPSISLGQTPDATAPGGPGAKPSWTNGNKQGIGTSNTLSSKVWFTLGGGALNEVYYPTVDKANTRSLEFIVTDGRTFAEVESGAADHRVEVLRADSLAFRQINTARSGRYRIAKTYITDPDRDTVLINVVVQSLKGERLRLFALFDPALNNSGNYDTGYSRDGALVAEDEGIASALLSSSGFTRTTSGFMGTSDGLADLKADFRLDRTYARAAKGNVVQVGELPASAAPFTLALGFGSNGARAVEAARASLKAGFDAMLERYNKGWRDYVATLKTGDEKYRAQFQMAAMVLKAHEDKTLRGAGIASLTVPWGDAADASEPNVGGYHNVWSRDLYHVATAFQAMGDKESADRALNYLFTVQQKKDGSFPQNSWLDGRPYWNSLQLDEVAYPLILAYELGRMDSETFERHVKPAANFIVRNGPATPQERWEEESGYSPSTIAAEIAGLVCAAEIARRNRDEASAALWLAVADSYERNVESWTATNNGPYGGRYFIRLAQEGRPDSGTKIELNNGAGVFDEREIVDAGFLELVRLGIRPAGDPLIKRSLEVVDGRIKVETPNGPAWYRYNHDGYGEKADGTGYDGTGVGRAWVLLTGERGEYALASGGDATPYLDAMARMANEGLMLPEQVWDRADSPSPHLRFGEGTGSATPLAWTNAQFIRLALAQKEKRPLAAPALVVDRYRDGRTARRASPKITFAPLAEEAAPGRKVMVTGTAEGARVVALVGNEVRELSPGPFNLPVELGREDLRIVVAAMGAGGETAAEQISIKPLRPGAQGEDAGPPDWSDRRIGDQLMSGTSPRINGPWVTFIYRGDAREVEVVGDMSDWAKRGLKMRQLAGTNVKYLSMRFPLDGRIEYRYVVDGQTVLDPLNPNRISNGAGGENSFFTMPGYKPPKTQ